MSNLFVTFKEVPGFEKISCTNTGVVADTETLSPILPILRGNKLYIVSHHYPKVAIGIHKLVALAWVENDDTANKQLVFHKDKDTFNNNYKNLYWSRLIVSKHPLLELNKKNKNKDPLEIKVIPGYEQLACTNDGQIFDSETLIPCKKYKVGDRYRVTSNHYHGKVLSVHRLVAFTWVKNDDPLVNTVVNHIDGNPLNNHHTNLEWTTYSGNSTHAVNTGLKSETNKCMVRDFETGLVHTFPSTAQAAEFMGMGKDTHYESLRFKQFGKLVRGRYEFRLDGDDEPWFYENRTEKITPARYKVDVTFPDGKKSEVFSTRSFLKEFQLYKSPYGKSIPSLAKHAKELYPDHNFNVTDYYTKKMVKIKTRTLSYRKIITCRQNDKELTFDSMTKCSNYFKISRRLVKNRLKTGNCYQGWIFTESSVGASSQKCD